MTSRLKPCVPTSTIGTEQAHCSSHSPTPRPPLESAFTMAPESAHRPFSVALVGGGITGVTLTIALLKRGIDVKIYEQARIFSEIGAGIAFSPNAKQAMRKCDPLIFTAYEKIATKGGSETKANTWYDWVDGYNQAVGTEPELLFTINRDSSADGCHRAHFIEALVKFIPDGIAEFNKRLEDIEEPHDDGPLTLKFNDGSSRTADVGESTSSSSSLVCNLC
jgi:salicylate hydroxylase